MGVLSPPSSSNSALSSVEQVRTESQEPVKSESEVDELGNGLAPLLLMMKRKAHSLLRYTPIAPIVLLSLYCYFSAEGIELAISRFPFSSEIAS